MQQTDECVCENLTHFWYKKTFFFYHNPLTVDNNGALSNHSLPVCAAATSGVVRANEVL